MPSSDSFYDITFKDKNYTKEVFPKWEYENCVFIWCDFSNSDLSLVKFIDCQFTNCDLSMVKVGMTSMQNISFENCKLHGILWNYCNPFLFEVSFRDCLLNFSSFIGVKLQKTSFINCNLEECDFTESDLQESIFEKCDFTRSIFSKTHLEKCDFRTAFWYQLDPANNSIKWAHFSLEWLPWLLAHYTIKIS